MIREDIKDETDHKSLKKMYVLCIKPSPIKSLLK
jgi:hypothetical protein